jgi:lycopene cyclase domain-containing protein
MTYLEFHLIVILPPIVLMGATLPKSMTEIGGRRARWALPVISTIAFVYTTPWDNYLVAREVWWYGPGRVLAAIGYVPIEEYLFFVLQPILTGLFLFQVLGRLTDRPLPAGGLSVWGGVLTFTALSTVGFGLLASGWPRGLYMGLVLAWASPLLAGMWLYDGETLWAYRKPMLLAVGIPTLYLWVGDAVAIASGVWTISAEYTVGVTPFGLPVEEATFFLVTNLLVVKGILLLLYGSHEAVAPSTVGAEVRADK